VEGLALSLTFTQKQVRARSDRGHIGIANALARRLCRIKRTDALTIVIKPDRAIPRKKDLRASTSSAFGARSSLTRLPQTGCGRRSSSGIGSVSDVAGSGNADSASPASTMRAATWMPPSAYCAIADLGTVRSPNHAGRMNVTSSVRGL
jgi:hypothetical protein